MKRHDWAELVKAMPNRVAGMVAAIGSLRTVANLDIVLRCVTGWIGKLAFPPGPAEMFNLIMEHKHPTEWDAARRWLLSTLGRAESPLRRDTGLTPEQLEMLPGVTHGDLIAIGMLMPELVTDENELKTLFPDGPVPKAGTGPDTTRLTFPWAEIAKLVNCPRAEKALTEKFGDTGYIDDHDVELDYWGEPRAEET